MRFTIHQPMMFAPIYLWARFASVEKLILLGEDFCKADGWHTRFRLNAKGQSLFIPVPLKDRFGKRIDEVEFSDPERFFAKLAKTLQQTYGKSRELQYLRPYLVELAPKKTFGEYCDWTTRLISGYLGLKLDIIDSRELRVERPSDASKWLAKLGCEACGPGLHTYVCAADATEKYLDATPLLVKGILPHGQEYTMPKYPGSTDATASILDLILRCGREDARKVLQSIALESK